MVVFPRTELHAAHMAVAERNAGCCNCNLQQTAATRLTRFVFYVFV